MEAVSGRRYQRFLPRSLLLLLLVSQGLGHPYFQQQIPNGEIVPHPCKPNFQSQGVGHENLNGGGKRNAFGLDFKANNYIWDAKICNKDSDGDGRTNGQELGDPDCTWTPGTAPKYSYGLSHPGFCEPVDDPVCAGAADLVDCSFGGFACPVMNETGTFSYTINLPETPVPAKETTYICMLFEFPTTNDFHLVAYTPALNNLDVIHHIVVYGCDPEKNVSKPLNQSFECNMRADEACVDILAIWVVGSSGICVNPNVGFKVGATGYRLGAIEMHWNNPQLRADYTDSSGITFYLTPNLRPNDAGVLTIGQYYLEIPPGQSAYSTEGRCEGSCTPYLMDGPIYITEAFHHMHYLGAAQKTELIRNNVSINLALDTVYNYDSPVIYPYIDPVRMDPGDELKTTCTFRSTSRTATTYFGESTSAEMCFAFLMYYPKENFKTDHCVSVLSIGTCNWHNGNVQGCDLSKIYNPAHPEMMALHTQVATNCVVGRCQHECLAIAREVKKQPCFSGDFGKYLRVEAQDRYRSSQNPEEILWYAALDSCDKELRAGRMRDLPSSDSRNRNVRSRTPAVWRCDIRSFPDCPNVQLEHLHCKKNP